MERAATSARRAFELFAPVQMVVSTGVAGALREELRAGTIVVADRLLSESTSGGAQASLEPPADRREDFVRALTVVGLSVVVGPTLTVPTALADAASKRRAHLESGAIAVDMESAVIAHEARRSGLDCMYLRSVLDAVDDRLPPVRLIDENGNVRPLTATGFFLSHPAMLFKWTPRVVRNMKIATANLAQALESLALSQA
jgi:nucleoside phosphorylase